MHDGCGGLFCAAGQAGKCMFMMAEIRTSNPILKYKKNKWEFMFANRWRIIDYYAPYCKFILQFRSKSMIYYCNERRFLYIIDPFNLAKDGEDGMMREEALQRLAAEASVEIIKVDMPEGTRSAYVRDEDMAVIGLSPALRGAEADCVCAEELGHHFTGSGDLLALPPGEVRRQRCRARAWAYRELVPLEAIARAYMDEDGNGFAMAERLGVTAAFLDEAIAHYAQVYGQAVCVAGYRVGFTPGFHVEIDEKV